MSVTQASVTQFLFMSVIVYCKVDKEPPNHLFITASYVMRKPLQRYASSRLPVGCDSQSTLTVNANNQRRKIGMFGRFGLHNSHFL